MNDTEERRDDPVESGALEDEPEGEGRGGPRRAGAPQEDRSVEERRRLTDEFRAARQRDDPEPQNPAR